MTGLADASLVIAALQPRDALHARAVEHLRVHGRLLVPMTVAVELLLGTRARKGSCVDLITAAELHFDIEGREVLLIAAAALDDGTVATVFDSLHLAEALSRGSSLHTADDDLLRTDFPTVPF